jgi:hypothetical protein
MDFMMSLLIRTAELALLALLIGLLVGVTADHSVAQAPPPGGVGGGGTGTGSVGNSGVTNNNPAYGQGASQGGSNGDASPICKIIPSGSGSGSGEEFTGDAYSECECGGSMSVPSLGGGSGGDNSTCSSCGGGNTRSGISSGPGSDFSAGDMKRFFVPNNQFNNSSFSPGYFSQFDSQLHI